MSEIIDFDPSSSQNVISADIRSAFEQPIIVLLGAGASMEANIPGSFGMTDEIVKTINDSPQYRYDHQSWALNFVCGALQAHSTSAGGNYHDSLDVEYVASAVALLARRHVHEVAPFVQQWNPAIEQVEIPPTPQFIENQIKRALSAGAQSISQAARSGGRQGADTIKHSMEAGSRDLLRAVLDIVDTRSGRRTTHVYSKLQDTMTAVLCEKVTIASTSDVEYLSPLVAKARSQGSLVVGTLNYDRSVEMLCAAHNLRCSTGIESWSSNRTFKEVKEGIQLIKLHGSVDWVDRGNGYTAVGRLPGMEISVQPWSRSMQGKPVIVFGRDKLKASGPFLDLLHEWEAQLQTADSLLIVGYSFRDDHVNETISRWVNESDRRHLYIVDPGWPLDMQQGDFRMVLHRQLGGGVYANDAQTAQRRVHVLRARTSQVLRLLLDPPPYRMML